MKFAIRFFKTMRVTSTGDSFNRLVVYAAVIGVVLGIPFMFIGGFKLYDLLIPVLSAGLLVLIVELLPFFFSVYLFLKDYRMCSIFNKKGYCREYLEMVKKQKVKSLTKEYEIKINTANIHRNMGETEEALEIFGNLNIDDNNTMLKSCWLYYYLETALQIKDIELFERIKAENREYIDNVMQMNDSTYQGSTTILDIYAECVKGNFGKAMEMYNDNFAEISNAGAIILTLATFLNAKLGNTAEAERMSEKAYARIDSIDTLYDFEKPVLRNKIGLALEGKMTLPYCVFEIK